MKRIYNTTTCGWKKITLKTGKVLKIYIRKNRTVSNNGDIDELLRYTQQYLGGSCYKKAAAYNFNKEDLMQEFMYRLCRVGLYYYKPKFSYEKYIYYDFNNNMMHEIKINKGYSGSFKTKIGMSNEEFPKDEKVAEMYEKGQLGLFNLHRKTYHESGDN
jgi:hypothetical protein